MTGVAVDPGSDGASALLRNRFRDCAPPEPLAGASRATRANHFVAVSETTASAGAPQLPGDTKGQVGAGPGMIEAVEALGGSRFDIIRTGVLRVSGADVDQACRAHVEVLGHVAPANTLPVVAAPIGPGLLAAIEADAVVGVRVMPR